MSTALALVRRICWLAFCAAPALANAGPSTENESEPVPVSRTDAAPAAVPLAIEFEQAVASQLRPPPDVVAGYATRLQGALDGAGVRIERPRFVALVDRSPKVQALLLLWGSAGMVWRLVGAAPASTGLPGRYEHFATPLGVYDHSVANPDYRAEGTKNEFGIRGYGRKGARVYDFGWVPAVKGWGNGAMSVMRLQMHATDPDYLEQRLGTAQSKGCIRIPAALNEFIDRYGVLDEDYQEETDAGRRLWVLRGDRIPTPWAGRYLVVVDSMSSERPDWSGQTARVEYGSERELPARVDRVAPLPPVRPYCCRRWLRGPGAVVGHWLPLRSRCKRLTLVNLSRLPTFQNRSGIAHQPMPNWTDRSWISPPKLTWRNCVIC